MPSATTSSALVADPGQLAIIPTVSDLKEETQLLEPPTVAQVTGESVDQSTDTKIEEIDDSHKAPEIHISAPKVKVETPVKSEPIIEIHGVEAEKPAQVEDQILFDAGVQSIPLDYEKMMQVILFCADVFLLGIIVFLSLR